MIEQAAQTARASTPSSSRRPYARSVSSADVFSPFPVKPEPVEPVLSRKRSAEDAGATYVKAEDFDNSPTPEWKRAKLETAKVPLAPNNRDDAGVSHPVGPTTPSENSVDDTRTKLAEVQQEISNIEGKLQRNERKLRPTKADFTRIAKYRTELASLKLKKERYNAARIQESTGREYLSLCSI